MGAQNAKILYESFASLVNFAALIDQGDHIKFRSAASFWSRMEGQTPVVRPNGLVMGGVITPAESGSNDVVDVAACKVYLGGELVTVSADSDIAVTRGLTTDVCCITSITVNSSGAVAAVAGTDGTAFSTTRGAAGGPPWIPTGSIEIGQVKLGSITASPVESSEIFQGIGVHVERFDLPSFSVVYGEAESGILGEAGVDFKSALPLIHSDDAGSTTAAKKVFARYYEPEFAQVDNCSGFTAPEKSHSMNSTQIYDGVLVSVSESLGAGGFTAYLQDGISDSFLMLKNKTAWFQFYPDKNQPVYLAVNGKLGVKRSWPASGGDIAAACTLSALEEGIEVYS